MYWELAEEGRRAASRAGRVDGDEYFVLYQINRGRRLVRKRDRGE